MEAKERGKPLNQRIRSGEIRKADVIRRLAELAFGKANDCVRLVLEEERNISKLGLASIVQRIILTPPAVEPAQPPIRNSVSTTIWLAGSHEV